MNATSSTQRQLQQEHAVTAHQSLQGVQIVQQHYLDVDYIASRHLAALHVLMVHQRLRTTNFTSKNFVEDKRKDYAFQRQFNEKPSIILSCPGPETLHPRAQGSLCTEICRASYSNTCGQPQLQAAGHVMATSAGST